MIVDPELPEWVGDALLMIQFGYDEQQVENMSLGVKVRLMYLYTQIEKSKAEASRPKDSPGAIR